MYRIFSCISIFLGNCGNTTIQSKLRTEIQQIEKYPDRADLNNLIIRKIITKIRLSHHRGEEKVGALPRTRKKVSLHSTMKNLCL